MSLPSWLSAKSLPLEPCKNHKLKKGFDLCVNGDKMTEVMLSRLTEVPTVYDGTNDLLKEMTRCAHLHAAHQSHQPFLQNILVAIQIEGSVENVKSVSAGVVWFIWCGPKKKGFSSAQEEMTNYEYY